MLMFAEYLLTQNEKVNATKYAQDTLECYEKFGTSFDQKDIERAKAVIGSKEQ